MHISMRTHVHMQTYLYIYIYTYIILSYNVLHFYICIYIYIYTICIAYDNILALNRLLEEIWWLSLRISWNCWRPRRGDPDPWEVNKKSGDWTTKLLWFAFFCFVIFEHIGHSVCCCCWVSLWDRTWDRPGLRNKNGTLNKHGIWGTNTWSSQTKIWFNQKPMGI